MDKKQFTEIIDLLDLTIMKKVQKNFSVSIDEEFEIEQAFEKIMKRKATNEEFDKIYYSEEFIKIIDEIDEYIDFHEKYKLSKAIFEDFTHDAPFGSGNRYRADVPMRGGE